MLTGVYGIMASSGYVMLEEKLCCIVICSLVNSVESNPAEQS